MKKKIVSLEALNWKIKYVKYEYSEKNRPPPVLKENLKKRKLIFSSSEMLCIVRYFRYLVGDLVLEEDPVWKFYLCLLEITDILTSHETSHSSISYLDN